MRGEKERILYYVILLHEIISKGEGHFDARKDECYDRLLILSCINTIY